MGCAVTGSSQEEPVRCQCSGCAPGSLVIANPDSQGAVRSRCRTAPSGFPGDETREHVVLPTHGDRNAHVSRLRALLWCEILDILVGHTAQLGNHVFGQDPGTTPKP